MKKSDFVILVVDDEADLRNSFKEYFEMDDYTVLTASCGVDGFEIVKNNKVHFIISDIMMPNGDGKSFLEAVRKYNPDIPMMVMVTGYSELTRDEAIGLGAMDLLAKPVKLGVLEKMIEDYFSSLAS